MKFRIVHILSIAMLALCNVVIAGHNWQRINYTNSTTFTGIVTINGEPVDEGDEIGIFIMDSNDVNLECRMIAEVFMNGGNSIVSSVIHGVASEQVLIRYWSESEQRMYEFDTTFSTNPGGDLRNVPLNLKTETESTDLKESRVEGLLLYPSPAVSQVTIDAPKDIAKVSLYDNLGKKVKSIVNNSKTSFLSVNVNDLTEGLYLLTIEYTDATVETERIYKK